LTGEVVNQAPVSLDDSRFGDTKAINFKPHGAGSVTKIDEAHRCVVSGSVEFRYVIEMKTR